nr:polyprenol phosphomannose-dependent alpha 1,6 mannosyltransferase MptB [Herbiconiux flava]
MRLVIGLVGSLMILAGSVVGGWLAPGSGLWDVELMAVLRNSRGAVYVAAMLVVGGVLLLMFAWLSLGLSLRRRDGQAAAAGPLRRVVTAICVWTAPLLFALPLFSRDSYAYVGQGRLLASGLDPYAHVMAELPNWYETGVDYKWSTTVTPYGPVFVWLQNIVVRATDSLPLEVTLFATRLVAVGGLALLIYYAWRIARLRGYDEAAVVWAVGASPLVLMDFVVSAHNDALMIGLIVAGTYHALRGRPLLAAVLVGLAIGVKPIAVVALPVIGIIWAGRRIRSSREAGVDTAATPSAPKPFGWPRLIACWAAVSAVAVGGVVAFGVGIGSGLGWAIGLGTPLELGSFYSPSRILSLAARDLANGAGLDGALAHRVVVWAFLAAGCAIVAFLVTVKRRADPLWLLVGSFAAIALCAPLLHPWYALWVLSLLGVAGIRRVWQLRVLVYATAFFAMVGIYGEQLDMIDRIRADPGIPTLYGWVGVIGSLVLLATFELALRRARRRMPASTPPEVPMLATLPARASATGPIRPADAPVSASSTPSP